MYNKIVSNSVLKIQLNIDDLPLFRSSSTSFWPVLCLLQGFNIKKPVLVGLFCGETKPSNLSEYFRDFVEDLTNCANEVLFREKMFIFKVSNIICDAPARAFVKAVKGHNAYHGCDKCTQTGEYIANRMTFPELHAVLRSDDSFICMQDNDHHQRDKGADIRGPFLDAGIGMVSQFPHNYRHLLCLGVVKKLINLWLSGPLLCRLSAPVVLELSQTLIGLRKFIPAEFVGKPRVLGGRQLNFVNFCCILVPLFYIMCCLLKCIITFYCFFVAIFCLASLSNCVSCCNYSKTLLINFVNHFAQFCRTKRKGCIFIKSLKLSIFCFLHNLVQLFIPHPMV